jgi:hypothetical protein
MKKLAMMTGLIVCAAVVVSGCGSVKVKGEFLNYKKAYVGWLDLGEQNWKKYGYPQKDEWVQEIKAQNGGLQKYVAGYLKGWTVTGAASKNAAAPREAGLLLVRFSNAVLNESNFSVKCGIEYVDAASGKVVKRAAVETAVYSYAPWWAFGAKVANTMQTLALEVLANMQK